MENQIDPVARAKMIEARKHVVTTNTFFGHLLLDRLVLVEDPACPTMATDGRHLWYGPAWARERWMPNLIFGLCHEVLHCANHHPERLLPGMDHDRANRAMDYSVNGYLIDNGIGTPPEGVLYRADLAGNAWEQNYAILSREEAKEDDGNGDDGPGSPEDEPEDEPDQTDETETPDNEPTDNGDDGQPGPDDDQGDQDGPEQDQGSEQGDDQGDGAPEPGQGDDGDQDGQDAPGDDAGGAGQPYPDDPSGCGSVLPSPATTTEERAEAEADWNVSTLQAAMAAEGMGDLPGDLQKLVDKIRNPQPGWEILLQDWFDERGGEGEDWCPPNEAFAHLGIVLPTEEEPTLGEVAILVDKSASMDVPACAAVADHIAGIFEHIRPERVYVIYVDTKINGEPVIFEDADEFTLEASPGGGTDFRPGFKWLSDRGIEPVGAIYFTDLDCTRFPEEPPYPVLWASTNSHATPPPWGDVVNLYD